MWDAQTIETGVLEEFAGLCRIPHPSGQEKAIAQHLTSQLEALGFSPMLDHAGNLLCDIPGSAGLENRPRLAVQAHMDMVCVGAPDYKPSSDPIRTKIQDGFLCTDGRSSLGADCGIGLSAIMYLLQAQRPHVPLRIIFTVDEERGLAGAMKLDRNVLEDCSGLINLDGFHFGDLMISSAGGRRQTFRRAPDCFFPMLDSPVALSISGLLGGHSGDDIAAGRANAAQLLLWLLQSVEIPYELAEVHAGTSHNAIPSSSTATIVVDQRDTEKLQALMDQFQQHARRRYPVENGLSVQFTAAAMPASVLTVDERDDFLALAGLVPCGVQEMHPLVSDVVGTSGTLGVLSADSSQLEIRSFLRSCQDAAMEAQGDFLAAAAEGFGYTAESDTYAAWPGVSEDPLSTLLIQQGAAMGLTLRKNAVHVGLEPSVFHQLAPDMPMISTGMDVLSPHSAGERVRISTIAPFVRLLDACLQNQGN